MLLRILKKADFIDDLLAGEMTAFSERNVMGYNARGQARNETVGIVEIKAVCDVRKVRLETGKKWL